MMLRLSQLNSLALMIWLVCLGGCFSSGTEVRQGTTPATPSPTPSSQTSSPTVVTPDATPANIPDASEPIWTQLRQGKGYVVMMRHTLAPGTGDPSTFRLDDCSTQRNLSEVGRSQAVRIGETFRRYDIPVARVLSSQWCRCLETARLLDLAPIEPFPALNSFFSDRSQEAQQTKQVEQLILQNRETSGVLVLVTHQVNITAISGIVPESGAAVVLRANGQNQIETVGQINN